MLTMNDLRGRVLLGWITLLLAMQAIGAPNAPNILYIFTDDHTYRMVSCFPRSYEFANTPNIDRLAERGVRFDQAYIGAKCVPSRASVQSGRLQFAVESGYNGSDIPGSIHWFPTIREKGYYTGMIGKWHYRQRGAEAYQHGSSWDWSVIWKHGDKSLGDKYYWDQYVSINDGDLEPLNGYSTDRYADYTEQFIQERAADTNSPPWFYWLCFGGVHAPYTPADRHIGTLDDEPEPSIPVDIYGPRPGKPSHFQDTKWTEGEDGKPLYGGETLEFWTKQQMEAVLAIDDAVGRIVNKLEETDQLDNTIIVFTADQGYVWGQHGLKGKIDPYETAIRSPFIVSNPARFPTNKVCKAPINGPDVIRTFHAWADAEPQQFMPGRDITPLIENPDSQPVLKDWAEVPTMMTYVGNRYEPMEIAARLRNQDWRGLEYESDTPYYFMILVENYKYTRYASPYRIEELYDLENDPEELDNLALKVQFQSKLREMRAACIQSLKDNGGAVFADLLPPPTTLNLWPDVYPSDNAHVLYGSGTAQPDGDVLKTKNGWGNSDSRMAYLRFNLGGIDEIAGHPADSILSASLDLWMTQTEGDVENDLQIYALVDGAQDSSASLSETEWTGSAGANPLLDTNLPQGNAAPTNSPLTTAMLGHYTFAATGDNSELGLVQIPLSVSGLKTLIQNDSNGEITLIVRSTSEGLSTDFASVANTNSQHALPTLTISTLPAAPAGLSANAGNGAVSLDWDDNAEPNLSGYNVYRSTNSGNYGSAIASNLVASSYFDNTVLNDTTYYYVVSAVDTDANESPQSTEVSAMPEKVEMPLNAIFFGSAFEGLAGFTQSTPATANESWSTETNSVRYRNQDGGTLNSSFLKEFPLDRSIGASYTIEAVVHLTDGYADDNNRVGIYLFGDSAEVPSEDEAGAIGLIFNTDDGASGGAPGDNSDDNIALRVGIDSTDLSGNYARNEGFVTFAQDLFGTEIMFTADIDFVDAGGTAMINITARLRDVHGAVTEASTSVPATDYTGDWFGFVTRARARNYVEGGENTAADRSLPWVMDYKSFRVADHSVLTPPTGLAATAGDGFVRLEWNDSAAGSVAGYTVYRSQTSDNYDSPLETGLTSSAFMDNAATNGATYYYVVTAVDSNGNESAQSTEVSALPEALYDQWASDHGIKGLGRYVDSDGDGMNNLYEYALGGAPTNRNHRGTLPSFSRSGSRFLYVHPRRADDASLVYTVETTTNLTSGTWTNLGYVVTGTNVTGGTLDFVTNDIDIVRNKNFIRLIIEQ
jgi:arylsulfatase A-like enzyme